MGGIAALLFGEGSLVADVAGAQPDIPETPIWLFIVATLAAVVFLYSPLARLRRGVRLGWRFTPQAGIGAVALMLLGGMLGGVAAGLLLSEDASMSGQLMLLGGVWGAQALVVGLLLLGRVIRPYVLQSGGHRQANTHQAVIMGMVGLAIFWPITVAVSAIGAFVQQAITGEAPSDLAHGMLPELIAAGPSTAAWAMVAAISVAPALLEEILYRGLIQESLRRMSFGRRNAAWGAIAVTSLIFTLMHVSAVSPHALPGLFVLSLGFGWVVARTGRLAAGVTMHLLFNAGNLLIAVPWITS